MVAVVAIRNVSASGLRRAIAGASPRPFEATTVAAMSDCRAAGGVRNAMGARKEKVGSRDSCRVHREVSSRRHRLLVNGRASASGAARGAASGRAYDRRDVRNVTAMKNGRGRKTDEETDELETRRRWPDEVRCAAGSGSCASVSNTPVSCSRDWGVFAPERKGGVFAPIAKGGVFAGIRMRGGVIAPGAKGPPARPRAEAHCSADDHRDRCAQIEVALVATSIGLADK